LTAAPTALQSKVDDYEKYLFVVIHDFTKPIPTIPSRSRSTRSTPSSASNFLVTVHDNPVGDHEKVWELARADKRQLERGPAWIAVPSARRHDHRRRAPGRGSARSSSTSIETAPSSRASGDPDLAEVFRIKRTTVAMRRVVRPLRDTVGILHRRSDERISTPRTRAYLRDLGDHVIRLTELVEETREVALGVVAGFQALQASKSTGDQAVDGVLGGVPAAVIHRRLLGAKFHRLAVR
jgi:Mg2+ and Co2+ transporter CorA